MRRLLLALVVVWGVLAPPAAAGTATFTPEADAFVSAAKPDENFGLNPNLRVDARPVKRSYLRFDVRLPAGAAVNGAVLRLYANSSRAADRFHVSEVADSSWGESTISYNNAPAATARLADSGGWSSTGWKGVALPAGALKAGRNSLRVDSVIATETGFKSRENTNKPQLVVDYTVSLGDTAPSPACSDGTDNDGDGKVDYPADPGCTGADDVDEADPVPPTADPVIGAAGDIATSSMRSRDTAALLGDVDRVLTLGDSAYPDGTLDQFNAYYEPTWGQHKAKTHPSVGNHEYHTPGAVGYFDYFGSSAGPRGKGWYSYDVGSWHLIALNSVCTEVSCAVGSEQEQWLRQDLAAHATSCTLAYWHHPRWNTGTKGNNESVAPLWNALYDYGAEVVVVGHDHNYQRHAPRNKSGTIDRTYGVRQFTAGTGGAGLYDIAPTDTEVHNDTTHGVLELTLRDGSYAWRFEPVAGQTFTDSGSESCHGKPGVATAGSGPSAGLTLTWSDEFDAPAGSPPDAANWTSRTGGDGWGNGELQCYTTRPENSSHDGQGNLRIVAHKERFGCGSTTNEYTSARIDTKRKREFQYGYIEARMRVPPGQGIWPAFWTLGADLDAVGWPASGEIDVLEVIGREPNTAHQTIHGPTGGGGHWQLASHTDGPAWHEQFHTYGVRWSESRITFYVDGTATRTLTPTDLQSGWQWAFNKPHFLLLNVAVGGRWPGYPDATTPFPATLLVDYVRVYQ